MSFKNFSEMIAAVKSQPQKRIAVAAADEHEILQAVRNAQDEKLTQAILVGNKANIEKICAEHHISLNGFEIINEPDHIEAARKCCTMVKQKEAHVIVKGLIDTAKYMKAILDKQTGLATGNLLSHVAVFETDCYHKLLFVTDAAINIKPNLDQKVGIIQNAVSVARMLGVEMPKVACCCGVEKVNAAAMPETIDAAILSKMNGRGQITGCMIDGPLGLDNAVNTQSAQIKKIDSPVAGDADIIMAPDLASGNFLYKTLLFLAKSRAAAIVAGAAAPVVLTSRADNHETKYLSIALGLASSQNG
jgi:phosphate butyryltransferase